jgi:hypothetical protein
MTEQERKHPETTGEKPVRAVRQWRVGTLSMGLLLVALGIILLAGKANPAWSMRNLLQYWPVLLIILGLEMVMLNIFSSITGSRFRLSYDVLSIIMVFIILFSSSVMMMLESTGAMDIARRALGGTEYYAQAEMVVPGDESLRSLIMSLEGSDKTVINTHPGIGDEVKVTIVYRGVFATQQEADEYAKAQVIGKERMGDTLAINLHPLSRGQLPWRDVTREVAIYVPQGLNVELNQKRGSIEAHLYEPKSRWIINHQSSRDLDISLHSVNSGKIIVQQAYELLGNIGWDEIRQDDEPLIEAFKSWGEGPFVLTIIHERGPTTIRTN